MATRFPLDEIRATDLGMSEAAVGVDVTDYVADIGKEEPPERIVRASVDEDARTVACYAIVSFP